MEQEKFVKLFKYAQRLGLSPQEVFRYFETKVKTDNKVAFSQVGQNNDDETHQEKLPCSGMFCYEDNTFSFDIRDDKVVKGIIVYVEGKRFLAVCLEEKRLPWSTSALRVKLNQKELDGAIATQNILAETKERRLKAEAAEWCYDFAQNGLNAGEAFLPSTYELIKISDNKERINKALKELDLVSLSGLYWSSNEADETSAVLVRLADAQKQVFLKARVGGFVRPVFWREF